MPEPTPPTNRQRPATGSLRPKVLPLVPDLSRPPGQRRPLPDAAAVRPLPVPDYAPPYDDEIPPDRDQAVLATGAPDDRPGDDGPRDHSQRDHGAGDRGAGDHGPRDRGAGDRSPRDQSPGDGEAGRPGAPQSRPHQSRPQDHDPAADGSGWPGQFAQVLAETLAGSRPPRQIMPWTTEQARKRINRLSSMLAAGDRPVVRRVIASSPAADVVEMTVVVRFGSRVRALAVRLERDGPRSATPGRNARQARWLCTAIEAA